MLTTRCTCEFQNAVAGMLTEPCASCRATHNLERWTAFLNDFQLKYSDADLSDSVLIERLNLKWLFEGKPDTWTEQRDMRRPHHTLK